MLVKASEQIHVRSNSEATTIPATAEELREAGLRLSSPKVCRVQVFFEDCCKHVPAHMVYAACRWP